VSSRKTNKECGDFGRKRLVDYVSDEVSDNRWIEAWKDEGMELSKSR